MKTVVLTLVVFLIFSSFVVTIAAGESTTMRCKGKIIELGDGKAKVLKTCGEPFLREEVGESAKISIHSRRRASASTRYIEKWTYDMGYGQFPRILTFRGNKLVRIEVGEKW
jgi:hypothetical protein